VVLVRDEDGDSNRDNTFDPASSLEADVYADSGKGRYSPTVINGTLVGAVGSGGKAFNSGIFVNENQRTKLGLSTSATL